MLNLWNFIIEKLLYPRFCVLCRSENNYLCRGCEQNFLQNKKAENFQNMFAKYEYRDEKVRRVLFKIKYKNNKFLAQELGKYSADFIFDKIKYKNLILVPVPISRERLSERGYNQSEEIAKGVAAIHKQSKVINLILKHKNTKKLFTQDKESRIREVENAFTIDERYIHEILNEKILIIDDITTSGATFYEIKKTLLKNGIKEESIFFFALAR